MMTTNADLAELKVSPGAEAKRQFIEPEISDPVDILEATFFFQGFIGAMDGTDIMP